SYAGGGSSRGSDFGQSGPGESLNRGGGGGKGGGGSSRELDDEIPF
ncbi:MAG: single-stranded DNA-binding protein, partial [Mesorhizobium sp.]